MAVSKLWSINEGGLSRVLQYAANPKKTNNKLYVSGINCEPVTAYEEFTAVKRSYAKTDGIEAYHGYLSFKEQDITPELTLGANAENRHRICTRGLGQTVSSIGYRSHRHRTSTRAIM